MPDPDSKPPIEERQAWVAQVQKDLRGDDLDMPLNDLVKTYRATAKERDDLKAKPAGLVVPGEGAKPEEVLAFHKALGVPENPEGYKLQLPAGLEDMIKPEEVGMFRKLAHTLHIPEAAAQKIIDFETKRAQDARKAFVDAQNAQGKATRDKLIEKYGSKVDEKLSGAFKVIEQFGGKEAVDELKQPIGNNFKLIDMLINMSTLFVERGILPTGTGATAEGEIDLRKVYPKSADQMGLK